jgi:TP901 family phage tail tape measure protein
MAISIGSIFASVGLKTTNFKKGMRSVKRSLSQFSRNMSNLGASINKNFTLPLIGAGTAAIKFSIDLNKAMGDVATLIPKNGERVKQLRSEIQQLAIDSGKSTGELATSMYDLISTFGDGKDSVNTLELATKSASAGLGSVKDSIGVLGAVTKNWGDTSLDAQKKVADLTQLTINRGKTSLQELSPAIQNVASSTNELGVSQEELFATFSSTTGVIGNSSVVSTQYKAALKALMNPTEGLSKAFKSMGIESGKALIKQRGLKGSLELIKAVAEKTNTPLQKLVGSSEAVSFTLALTGAQSKKFSEDLAMMKRASGSLDVAFKAQTEGINKLGFEFDKLKQRLIVSAQILGEALSPAVAILSEYAKTLSGYIKKWADEFKKLDPEIKGTVIQTTLLISGLGLLFTGISSVTAAMSVGIGVILKYSSALTLLGKTAAVVSSLFAGWQLGSWLNDTLSVIPKVATVISIALMNIWEDVTYSFDVLLLSMEKKYKEFLSDMFSSIGELFQKASDKLKGFGLDGMSNKFKGAASWFYDVSVKYDKDKTNYKELEKQADEEYERNIKANEQAGADRFREIDAKFGIYKTKTQGGNPSDKNLSQLTDLERAQQRLKETLEETSKKLQNMTFNLKGQTPELQANTEKLNQLKNNLKDIGIQGEKTFGETMKDAIKGWSQNLSHSLSNMVKESDFSFKKIKESFLDMTTSTILSNGFQKILGGFGGKLKLPFFANGGFSRNEPFIAGEKGAELVVPSSASRIYNAADTSRILAGRGSGETYHIHMTNYFDKNVGPAARQEVLNAMPTMEKRILSSIRDKKRRGKW